eukprot:Platyproteum_vivax@DN3293_c0_g1_i1.p1
MDMDLDEGSSVHQTLSKAAKHALHLTQVSEIEDFVRKIDGELKELKANPSSLSFCSEMGTEIHTRKADWWAGQLSNDYMLARLKDAYNTVQVKKRLYPVSSAAKAQLTAQNIQNQYLESNQPAILDSLYPAFTYAPPAYDPSYETSPSSSAVVDLTVPMPPPMPPVPLSPPPLVTSSTPLVLSMPTLVSSPPIVSKPVVSAVVSASAVSTSSLLSTGLLSSGQLLSSSGKEETGQSEKRKVEKVDKTVNSSAHSLPSSSKMNLANKKLKPLLARWQSAAETQQQLDLEETETLQKKGETSEKKIEDWLKHQLSTKASLTNANMIPVDTNWRNRKRSE